jgi:hypothetical protein
MIRHIRDAWQLGVVGFFVVISEIFISEPPLVTKKASIGLEILSLGRSCILLSIEKNCTSIETLQVELLKQVQEFWRPLVVVKNRSKM